MILKYKIKLDKYVRENDLMLIDSVIITLTVENKKTTN